MGGHIERHFNLVEENWIPVAGTGRVSLKRVFSDPDLTALGGSPVEKIALTKLLLAIAQVACTPESEQDWAALGPLGLADKARNYLEDKKDQFWLYGDRPFLQMPVIAQADKKPIGVFLPDAITGNSTILTESQMEREYDDAEKALILVYLTGFALGGKQPDNKIILSKDYSEKSSTAKPGPFLGYSGYLHSFLFWESLQGTIWLNLLTRDHIYDMQVFPEGVGNPPWEQMPEGEDCPVAKQLKESLMGRLVPLCRFALLNDSALHCSEGISHPTHKNGGIDPSITVSFSNNPRALWVDPEKRPWRELTSLLSFFDTGGNRSFDCPQLRIGMLRAMENVSKFSIWSGGIRVSGKVAGEQKVTGRDDYLESEVILFSEWLKTGTWFACLQHEMSVLEAISKAVYSATLSYFKPETSSKRPSVDGKKHAATAVHLFWQLCERSFQDLVNACNDETGEKVAHIRRTFVNYANEAFNAFCPSHTARQIDAWAENRPDLWRFTNRRD